MTKQAWDDYYMNARDYDELMTITKTGQNWLGPNATLYLTAVDSIDTLYIMGLKEEYEQAKGLIAKLDFDRTNGYEVSVFETNIRVLGGLLSIYELTGEELFLEKAVDIADRLLPAFDTVTGLPAVRVSLTTQVFYDFFFG
jgi:mannosyl-oligosaccharide alpha-1,2-mannosidase